MQNLIYLQKFLKWHFYGNFYDNTSTERIDLYKNDLKKFAGIRVAVNNIYVDNVKFCTVRKNNFRNY